MWSKKKTKQLNLKNVNTKYHNQIFTIRFHGIKNHHAVQKKTHHASCKTLYGSPTKSDHKKKRALFFLKKLIKHNSEFATSIARLLIFHISRHPKTNKKPNFHRTDNTLKAVLCMKFQKKKNFDQHSKIKSLWVDILKSQQQDCTYTSKPIIPNSTAHRSIENTI
jgi:hypothetical protein